MMHLIAVLSVQSPPRPVETVDACGHVGSFRNQRRNDEGRDGYPYIVCPALVRTNSAWGLEILDLSLSVACLKAAAVTQQYT